jgi:hypothetical protein
MRGLLVLLLRIARGKAQSGDRVILILDEVNNL